MYTQTLYELSQEAERLLQLSRQQLQLLEKMPLSVPGDDAPQLALPWSQPNIAERHAMLNNELRKISRLEMVLAIVGTMKAGKSTTINAIVGTEVLQSPNDCPADAYSPYARANGTGTAFFTCRANRLFNSTITTAPA